MWAETIVHLCGCATQSYPVVPEERSPKLIGLRMWHSGVDKLQRQHRRHAECDKRGLHGVKLRPERRRKGIERRAEMKPEVAFLLHSGAYAVVGIDKAPRKAGQLLKFHRWYRKPCAAGRAG